MLLNRMDTVQNVSNVCIGDRDVVYCTPDLIAVPIPSFIEKYKIIYQRVLFSEENKAR